MEKIMKHLFLLLFLAACNLVSASETVIFSFPSDKFGKGPGLTQNGETITFAPVSRMYIDKKFDPAGGRISFRVKFHPVPADEKDKTIQHHFWAAHGNNSTVASGIILEKNDSFQVHFYAFNTKKKPVACTAKVKLPADKTIELDFIWNSSSISIKVNGLLFAKKNYSGTLLPGTRFMIGTSSANRAIIPMTLEKLQLYAPASEP